MHIQLELECIGVRNGLLVRIPCDEPDDIARFTIARHADGYTAYVRHDVTPHVRDQLRALPPSAAWSDTAMVTNILAADHGGDIDVWRGRPYTFQRLPEEHEFPDVVQNGDGFAVVVDGIHASWAWSARSNRRAAELAVETVPAFRQRGYARQVVLAWARHQLNQGKVAFYSHASENVASQALAASVGVVHFMDIVNYQP
jgi:GNAT superfamily N-acetyltransferase